MARRKKVTTQQAQQDRRYLYRIGHRWYARIPVPNPLRPKLGPFVQRALGTADLSEAKRRRWDVMEEVRALFAQHGSNLGLGTGRPPEGSKRQSSEAGPYELVLSASGSCACSDSGNTYEAWRGRLKLIGPVAQLPDGEDFTPPELDRLTDKLNEEDAGLDDPRVQAVRDHIKNLPVASEILSDYLEHNPKRNPTTVTNYRATLKLWIDHQGDKPLANTTRRQAFDWLDTISQGKAKATIGRYVGVMSTLWDWALRFEEDPPANPFSGIKKAAGSRGQPGKSYGVFTEDELGKLFATMAEKDQDLHAMALVSLFSGLRLAECLKAKRHVIDGVEVWDLDGGKTVNARRIVPVHSRLADVQVPDDMTPDMITKRFTRTCRKLGLPEGKSFHSLRKCFTTALERSGCPEEIAVRLLGHRPVSMSYRVYSAGRDVRELQGWVEKVRFPGV